MKIETHDTRAVGAVETRTTYFFWVLFLNALKAHSLHTDKPSQMVSGSKEQVHVTKWEGTQRSCGGGVRSDLAADPPSQLQTGALRRQVEPTIGSLLL